MGLDVTVTMQDGIAWVTMDDGKVNALSLAMLQAVQAGLEEAEARAGANGAVVLRGRDTVFSGGFDLATLAQGGTATGMMLQAGARLAVRLLESPVPLVAAVRGPAVAMGAFVALGADWRIGCDAPPHKIVANEVAIGLTLPRFATELLRHRLAPAAFDAAAITAAQAAGAAAVAAGWFNEVVAEDTVLALAQQRAQALAKLDRRAFSATKARVRARVVVAMGAAIEADAADWQARIAAA